MVVAALSCLGCRGSGSAESLVPAGAGESPNAWCTWATQNLSLVPGSVRGDGKILFAGDQGAAGARENIEIAPYSPKADGSTVGMRFAEI